MQQIQYNSQLTLSEITDLLTNISNSLYNKCQEYKDSPYIDELKNAYKLVLELDKSIIWFTLKNKSFLHD